MAAQELPHQILEELGRLCSFRDLLAARSTCRAWHSFLTQQAFSQGAVLRVSASPNAQSFNIKAHALAHIFPGIRELVLHVGSRVTKDALNQEVASLAAAFPGLESLEVHYIQPCSTKIDDTPTVTVMGGWLLPTTGFVLTAHDPVPGGLNSFPKLRSLKLRDVRTPPGLMQLKRLPSTLTTLSIGTADVLDGLGEVGTGPLPIGPSLPHLLHLQVDVRCGRAAGSGGLAGLSKVLKSLEMHGIIDLGEHEVKALCDLTQLQHLSVQVPCDQYHAASKLLSSHPSLRSLALTLNQDESQFDFHESFTTDVGAILLHLLEEAKTAESTRAHQQPTSNGTLQYNQPRHSHSHSPIFMNGTGSSTALNTVHTAQEPGSGTYNRSRYSNSSTNNSNGNSSSSSSSWQHQRHGPHKLSPHTCNPLVRLTSLTLQSCSLQPAAALSGAHWGARGSSFLDLVACLTGLQSLHIEEPLPLEVPMRGSLMQLTELTNLRSLAISLMAGLPIPALTITPEFAPALAASCPHLSELTALNAIQPDHDNGFSFLTALTGLRTLALSPCSPCSSSSGNMHDTQHSVLDVHGSAHNMQHGSMHDIQHGSTHDMQHGGAHNAHQGSTHNPISAACQSSAPGAGASTCAHSNGVHNSMPGTSTHRMPLLELSQDLPMPHLTHLSLSNFSIMSTRKPRFAPCLRGLVLSNCELLEFAQPTYTYAASSDKSRVSNSPCESGEGCDGRGVARGSHTERESLADGVQAMSLGQGENAYENNSANRGTDSGSADAVLGDAQQGQQQAQGTGQVHGHLHQQQQPQHKEQVHGQLSSQPEQQQHDQQQQHQHQHQHHQQQQKHQQQCQEQHCQLSIPSIHTGKPHSSGALSPAELLAGLSGLQSLQLIQVDGVNDDTFPHLSTLNNLTSLRILPAPCPPIQPYSASLMRGDLRYIKLMLPPRLSQAGLAHCSCLTELRTLDWACWAGDVSPLEPHFVEQLAMGAKGLHVLSLAPTQEPEVRASTLEVVQRCLPLCVVDENVPL